MRAASTAQRVFTVTARRVTSAPLLQGHIAESDAITYTSGSRCGWRGGPRVEACSVNVPRRFRGNCAEGEEKYVNLKVNRPSTLG